MSADDLEHGDMDQVHAKGDATEILREAVCEETLQEDAAVEDVDHVDCADGGPEAVPVCLLEVLPGRYGPGRVSENLSRNLEMRLTRLF